MNSIVFKKYNTQQLQRMASMPGGMGNSALAELERRKTISSFDEPQATAQVEPTGMMASNSNDGRVGSIRSRLDTIEERLNSMESGSEDVTEPSPTPPPPVEAGGVSGIAGAIQSISRPEKAAQDMFGTSFMRQESLGAAKIENNKKI